MFLPTINRTLNSGKGQLEMIGSSGHGEKEICRVLVEWPASLVRHSAIKSPRHWKAQQREVQLLKFGNPNMDSHGVFFGDEVLRVLQSFGFQAAVPSRNIVR